MTVRLGRFDRIPQSRGWHLLISTVPAGAADIYAERILPRGPRSPPPSSTSCITRGRPGWRPPREQAGAVVIGGFELLLHQAARQVELMTGRAAPVAAMRQAGLAELAAPGG